MSTSFRTAASAALPSAPPRPWFETYVDEAGTYQLAPLRAAVLRELGLDYDHYPPRLRERDIVRPAKRARGRSSGGILNCSARTFRLRIAQGLYPLGLKHSERITSWLKFDIFRVALAELAAARQLNLPRNPLPPTGVQQHRARVAGIATCE